LRQTILALNSLPDINLSTFFQYCVSKNLPLAFYRLPQQKVVQVLAQKKPTLKYYADGANVSSLKGFLFAPFQQDKNFKRFIIQPDIETTSAALPELNFATGKRTSTTKSKTKEPKEATKEEYKDLVKKIRLNIEKERFRKIVAARIIKKKKPTGFNSGHFFEQLCKTYPEAFVSLVFTPEYGTWLGASPEVLLQMDEHRMTTYSLAGTQANVNGNANHWTGKERDEQQLISDYIQTSLKKLTLKEPVVKGPETMKAGNLLHLLTTFSYPDIAFNKWSTIAEKLHPTPAIAGLPKKEAIDFILKNEIAPRGFYSGYLGPVSDSKVNLFVNLRCMSVTEKELVLHVGSGITSGSKPTDEWRETKLKAQTLLEVLKK